MMTKDKWINIRCTEQERQDITKQAKEHNMSVAEFIRYLVAKERKEREK
jgi:predicted DNA binding CopG/RHH family protein